MDSRVRSRSLAMAKTTDSAGGLQCNKKRPCILVYTQFVQCLGDVGLALGDALRVLLDA